MGLAVILLTIIIRVVLWPLFHKGAHAQAVMSRIQPQLKKIQEDHKRDKARQAELMMALYREHKVNPLSGLMLLAVQIPVFIALWKVFNVGLSETAYGDLYSFMPGISAPINHYFLSVVDLARRSIPIAVVAAAAQFVQGKLSLAKAASPPQQATEGSKNPMANMGKQMVYTMPAVTIFILWGLPSAIGLYWLTTTIFSIIQQIVINRSLKTWNPTNR